MKKSETEQELNSAVSLQQPKLAKSWLIRCICIVLAWLCLAIGSLGIIVPGLPTFDFYFLAAIFAAKGSAKLHHWIVSNRFISPILQHWQHHRKLPMKVKILSLFSMSCAAILMMMTIPHPWAVGVIVMMMVSVQCWIWFRT